MHRGKVTTAVLVTAAAIILGVSLTGNPAIQTDPESRHVLVDRPQVPAEPAINSVRDEEGGPDQRRDFELRKLIDPATGELPVDIFNREQVFAASLPVRDNFVAGLEDKSGNLTGWTYRGPYNQGGRTRAFAPDISDGTYQTFLAGGVSGGMWRSTNEGADWTMVTGSTQLHSVTTVAQDTRPGNENVWYYGTGESRGNSAWGGGNSSYRGDGIFKSIDSGLTWSLLPSTSGSPPESFVSPWQYVNRIVTDPTNFAQDEVYAAHYGQIERSVDGGNTWTAVLGSYGPWSAYTEVVISPSGVVYGSLSTGGDDAGIFRSTDGISWANITPPGLTTHGRIVMALAPSDEDILYAYVSDVHGTTDEGLYRYQYLSGDGAGTGGVWSDRSGNLSSLPGGYYGTYTVNTYSNYCMSLAVKPDDPNTVFLGGVELTRSTDGFATNLNTTWVGGWTYDNQHADQHEIFFLPGSSSVAYTGSDGGVHKTLDANAPNVTWISMNNGYNTAQFYTVAVDEFVSGSDIVLGGTQDNGTQWTNMVNPTGNWIEQWGGDGSYCAVANTDWAVAEYYFSSQNGRLYYEGLDNAGSWYDWTRIEPTGAGDYLFINPFILDPNDENVMYVATSNGVWRNHDLRDLRSTYPYSNSTQTLHWTQLTTTPTDDYITALAVTRNGGRTLYYGTELGGLYRVDNSHTAPGGTVPVTLPSPATGYVSCIAVDPLNDQNLMVSFSNYNVQSIWRSNDGGSTWTDVEGNLGGSDGPSIRSVNIVHRAGYEIWFAGTSVGLYSKTIDDALWAREADDLIGTVVVDFMASRSSDGLLAVGTHGRGIFSIQIPEGVVAAEFLTLDTAQRKDEGVVISWHASQSLYNHQLFVYRERSDGSRVQVNDYPLRGDQSDFTDQSAPAGETTYYIMGVGPDRTVTWYGPITVAGAGAGSVFSFAGPSPNPFRVESALAFTLPRPGMVNISIFDIRGRLVRILSDEVMDEGPHRAVWDGRTEGNVRAAAGIYYAKLRYDNKVRTQKITLIK